MMDESGSFGWLLLGSIVLIVGGFALLTVTVGVTAKVAGGTLALMGLALLVGAITSRSTAG